MVSLTRLCVSKKILDKIYNSRESDFRIILGYVEICNMRFTITVYRLWDRNEQRLSENLRFGYTCSVTRSTLSSNDYTCKIRMVVPNKEPHDIRIIILGSEIDQTVEQSLAIVDRFDFDNQIEALIINFELMPVREYQKWYHLEPNGISGPSNG